LWDRAILFFNDKKECAGTVSVYKNKNKNKNKN
jgi:hypothetical protein